MCLQSSLTFSFDVAVEVGQGVPSAVTSDVLGDIGGVLRSAMGLVETTMEGANCPKILAEQVTKATRTSPVDVMHNQS